MQTFCDVHLILKHSIRRHQAGTQLWDAAIVAVTYVYKTYHEEISQGIKLIELGCGTGVPGMCCRTMGAEVLLTEQVRVRQRPMRCPVLTKRMVLSALARPINPAERGRKLRRQHRLSSSTHAVRWPALTEALPLPGDAGIRVEVLSWDRERSKEVMKKNGTFDMILVCDCVFPPVYGSISPIFAAQDWLTQLLPRHDVRF